MFQSIIGLGSCLGIQDFLWQVLWHWWKHQAFNILKQRGRDLTNQHLPLSFEKNMGCLNGSKWLNDEACETEPETKIEMIWELDLRSSHTNNGCIACWHGIFSFNFWSRKMRILAWQNPVIFDKGPKKHKPEIQRCCYVQIRQTIVKFNHSDVWTKAFCCKHLLKRPACHVIQNTKAEPPAATPTESSQDLTSSLALLWLGWLFRFPGPFMSRSVQLQ